MMKRVLSLALLVTMFAATSMSANWPAVQGYKTQVDAIKEAVDKAAAQAELDGAEDAFDALEHAKADDKLGSTDATKKAVADAQKAFDAAVAKLDARFPSLLCKVEGVVTWPARKAGELLSSKWGARGATAVGLGAVAYVVYTAVADNGDEDDAEMRNWA